MSLTILERKELTKSENFVIYVLDQEDVEEAVHCILETFLQDEPMCSALGLTKHDFELFVRLYTEKAALDGLSVVARHPLSGEMMGCIISEDMCTNSPLEIEKIPFSVYPIIALLEQLDKAYLEQKHPIPNQFFHMFICGVYKKFSGLQITQHLTLASENLAREHGFESVLIEATGPISQYVLQHKLGYRLERTLAYHDFCFEGNYPYRSVTNCFGCQLLSKKI